MSARSRMTMRAYIQRNGATADTHGQTRPTSWAALSTTPAWVWVDRGDTRHREPGTAEHVYYRGIVPKGTDVTSRDRIQKVTDRLDVQLFGILDIDSVIPRRDHIELRMRAHA